MPFVMGEEGVVSPLLGIRAKPPDYEQVPFQGLQRPGKPCIS